MSEWKGELGMTRAERTASEALAKKLDTVIGHIGFGSVARDTVKGVSAELRNWYVKVPEGRDGKPIHVGETVYGEDGKAWLVTGYSFGNSPYTVLCDGEGLFGCKRNLKPRWCTHEPPDSAQRIARDAAQGAMEYPRERMLPYLNNGASIREAFEKDIRKRVEALCKRR